MAEQAPTGRPTLYSPELADKICEGLENGYSLVKICEWEGMPHRSTVIRWMGKDEAFATKCARARDEQADLMDDRILDVANKVESGELEPRAGSVVLSALQWRAEKLKPKKYGKVTTLKGDADNPLIQKPVDVTNKILAMLTLEQLEQIQQEALNGDSSGQ